MFIRLLHNFLHYLASNPTLVYSLTVYVLFIDASIAFFDKKLREIKVSAVIRAIILFFLACIILQSSFKDANWKDDVTQFQNLNLRVEKDNKTLALEIDTISKLDTSLSTTANNLAFKIESLTEKVSSIAERLDIKTDQEFQVTGEFNFPVDSTLNNGTLINAVAGEMPGSLWNLGEIRNRTDTLFSYKTFKIYFSKYKFIITGKIYDLQGKLIVEIVDNKWRLNKNAVSKFNYDKKGFEVFDNTGRVAINVNFLSVGNRTKPDKIEIQVQGIIPSNSKDELTLFINNQYQISFPYGTYELNKKIKNIYDSHPIQPLFKYVGLKWRNVRNI